MDWGTGTCSLALNIGRARDALEMKEERKVGYGEGSGCCLRPESAPTRGKNLPI